MLFIQVISGAVTMADGTIVSRGIGVVCISMNGDAIKQTLNELYGDASRTD